MDKEYSETLKTKLQGIDSTQLNEIDKELRKIHKENKHRKRHEDYEDYKESVNRHEKNKYEGKVIKKHHEKYLKRIEQKEKAAKKHHKKEKCEKDE